MRPCVTSPWVVRDTEFGGPKPLFCIPLVATELNQLLMQAEVAHHLRADVVEWRADSFSNVAPKTILEAASALRSVLSQEPLLFTLRVHEEGGAKPIAQDIREQCINAVVQAGTVDLVDIELCNGIPFLAPIIRTAHQGGQRVILSFHDFQTTPSNEEILGKIAAMVEQGADIAKVACMPRDPADALRLLDVTFSARQAFPNTPLCTTSMGPLGVITRVAGFLYGSDMAFAAGAAASAPGQIPMAEARAVTNALLRNI